MLIETLKIKTASLRLFALATLMTVVSSVTAQTLLEENFSSGFEKWTAVNPPGSFSNPGHAGDGVVIPDFPPLAGWSRGRDSV